MPFSTKVDKRTTDNQYYTSTLSQFMAYPIGFTLMEMFKLIFTAKFLVWLAAGL